MFHVFPWKWRPMIFQSYLWRQTRYDFMYCQIKVYSPTRFYIYAPLPLGCIDIAELTVGDFQYVFTWCMQILVHRPMVNFFLIFGSIVIKIYPWTMVLHWYLCTLIWNKWIEEYWIYMCVRYMMHSCIHACKLSFVIRLP